jgi:hypothetical protein
MPITIGRLLEFDDKPQDNKYENNTYCIHIVGSFMLKRTIEFFWKLRFFLSKIKIIKFGFFFLELNKIIFEKVATFLCLVLNVH